MLYTYVTETERVLLFSKRKLKQICTAAIFLQSLKYCTSKIYIFSTYPSLGFYNNVTFSCLLTDGNVAVTFEDNEQSSVESFVIMLLFLRFTGRNNFLYKVFCFYFIKIKKLLLK